MLKISIRIKMIGVLLATSLISIPISKVIQSLLQQTGLINDNLGIYINTFISLIVTTLLSILFIQWILLTPLKKILQATKKVAEGNLDIEIDPNRQFRDEISDLYEAFEKMTTNLNQMVKTINITSMEVTNSAVTLSASTHNTMIVSEDISRSVCEVAAGSMEQYENINKISNAINHVTNEINSIYASTKEISATAKENNQLAKDGEVTVEHTVKQMNEIQLSVLKSDQSIKQLKDRSKQIEGFLTIITNIANQTNLLALNAAIEAARAGEAGKGFSVVATEIRKLAEQSSESATQIADVVQLIQEETAQSVSDMQLVIEDVIKGINMTNSTKEILGNISNTIDSMTDELANITSTNKKMTTICLEVTDFLDEVNSIARQNNDYSTKVSAASEEQFASIEEISSSTDSLTDLAQKLKVVTSQFKIKH